MSFLGLAHIALVGHTLVSSTLSFTLAATLGGGGDMSRQIDRRSFVELAALGLTGVGVTSSWLERWAARLAVASPNERAVFVRPEIHSVAGQAMVSSLRAGVTEMRARSAANANDPTGWEYQWKMHGTYDAATKLAWKTCQHGNFFFTTWHRMYLYYFERIMRKASSDPNFALPYWNYEPAAQRSLPTAFRENPTTNSLYFTPRGSGMNEGTAEVTDGDPSWALLAAQFNGAQPTGFGGTVRTTPGHSNNGYGRLEWNPHNFVHDNLGGDMGDPNTAANDPIFWLHHCNIDRLWSYWRTLDTSNHTDPTTNAAWMNTLFTFFDENGSTVQMKGADVLDTVGQLGYRYDTESLLSAAAIARLREMLRRHRPPFQDFRFFTRPFPWPPEPPAPWRDAVALSSQRFTIDAAQTIANVPISRDAIVGIRRALTQPAATNTILVLEGLSVRRPPGGRVDVFLLAGKQSTDAALAALNESAARFYVGTLNFFSIFGESGTREGVRNAVLAVDVSDVVSKQMQRLSANGDTLSVLFQFNGVKVTKDSKVAPPQHPISIDRISVRVVAAPRNR